MAERIRQKTDGIEKGKKEKETTLHMRNFLDVVAVVVVVSEQRQRGNTMSGLGRVSTSKQAGRSFKSGRDLHKMRETVRSMITSF
jgi:hypothetical protein